MYIKDVNLSPLVVSEPRESYQPDATLNRWVEVLVDCPGSTGLFTYRLPAQLEIKPGDILSVPFGAQQLGAIAIRLLTQLNVDLPPEKIREVEDIVSVGFFPSAYWELLNRVAAYYYTPLIQVIRVALPPGLLGRSQRRIRVVRGEGGGGREQGAGNRGQGTGGSSYLLGSPNPLAFLTPTARQVWELLQGQAAGDYSFVYLQQKVKSAYRGIRELLRFGLVESYLEPPRLTRPKLQKAVTLTGTIDRDLTTRQREILEVLRRRGGELWLNEFLQICKTTTPTLKGLEEKGYIVIEEREVLRTEQGPALVGDSAKSLTTAQASALETIQTLNGFAQVLLHGVTGSGKTEVYLQVIAPLLNQGESALVLVPEIGLTPQLTDRFRARFGNKVSVYHSALSDGERYDTWRQMLAGEPQVVIGTRSAVFAPLPNLGLIILDEEHDSSFKQDSPIPTYHARTVAQWRAELENCPLVLGSATPSLESWVSVRGQGAGEQGGRGAGEAGGRGQGAEGEFVTPNSSLITHYSLLITHYLSLPERVNSSPLPP
ncbi:primosomal protein N', partial [Nostoc sp. KVJ20]|uniref:replication restart helicase PriA n=1 Tax=Nostoc sp. KVJ20 TaxID=457944 RepID=UPI000A024E74